MYVSLKQINVVIAGLLNHLQTQLEPYRENKTRTLSHEKPFHSQFFTTNSNIINCLSNSSFEVENCENNKCCFLNIKTKEDAKCAYELTFDTVAFASFVLRFDITGVEVIDTIFESVFGRSLRKMHHIISKNTITAKQTKQLHTYIIVNVFIVVVFLMGVTGMIVA